MHPEATSFRPPEPVAAAIIAALADPAASFLDIASKHQTTLEALTLWITRPDIAERLENIHHIAAARIRLIAANIMPQALGGLTDILAHTRKQIEADAAAPPDQRRTPEQRQRTLETCRRAASRMVCLANFNPIPLFSRPIPRAYPAEAPPQPRPLDRPTSRPAAAASPNQPAPPVPTLPEPRSSAPPFAQTSLPTPRPPFISPKRPRPVAPSALTLTSRAGAATALLAPHEHWP
jgi:hypothetical protein